MGAHLKDEHRQRQRRGDPQPPLEIDIFRVRPAVGRRRHRFQRHAAFGAVAGMVLDDFGMHRAGILGAFRHRFGRGLIAQVLFRIRFEFRLASGRAEIMPLTLMPGHMLRACAFDGHAADRVARGAIALGVVDEFRPATVRAEVIGMPVMCRRRFARLRIHSHAADRIADDLHRRVLSGLRVEHGLAFPSENWVSAACRASSCWRVKR